MTKKGLTQSAQSSSPKMAKIAAAVAVAIAAPATQAVGISWGEWEGSFDTTISIGASWRVEKQDPRLIGYGKALDGATGLSFSHNGDDGNMNFHKGDSFSEVIKGVHDFGLQHSSGVGFFIRGAWLYDNKIENGDFRYYGTASAPSPYFADDPRYSGFNQSALDIHGTETRLLDAYIYNTWQFEESVLQVRLGEQVINWGESTFIQHSISEANPIDITKLRVPGAELKEAFLPVQTLWASFDISPTLTLESYVQFEWDHVRLDEPGTYFATADYLGESGDYIWLNFARAPEFTPATAAYRLADRDARDDGQFGIKLGWFAEDLGATEFGFYYINYHNKRPIISANKFQIDYGAANGLDPNIRGVTGYAEYIEDIELYGISFNTQTDSGLSIAGEVSYRVDEPLQVDDVELLFATLEGISPNVPRGSSQLNGSVAPGEKIDGYRLFDTIQAQATITNLFGPGLGASQWTGLVEIGMNQIQDMPSQDVLRFEAPGTSRSGSAEPRGLIEDDFRNPNAWEGQEENSAADEFSWGYRLVVKADYTNAIGAWNVSPRVIFQHDVSGTTPAPISNFVEGRKALALGTTFDYLARWKIDASYNRYFGAGTANLLSDRDFVALTASYSF
ncbi:MAG: DUF1302 domain-containing protein [Gammaproteobacteria bacterium]|nr:DUF1302 domain-containing protein [Gammaproteobacteria bacterium]NVK88709.1 DUF1302 domain-containing protein [Gammaproteobacteria bacterium]